MNLQYDLIVCNTSSSSSSSSSFSGSNSISAILAVQTARMDMGVGRDCASAAVGSFGLYVTLYPSAAGTGRLQWLQMVRARLGDCAGRAAQYMCRSRGFESRGAFSSHVQASGFFIALSLSHGLVTVLENLKSVLRTIE